MRISSLRDEGKVLPVLVGFLSAAGMAWLLVLTHRYDNLLPLFVSAAIHVALTVGANALGVHIAGYLLFRNVTGAARLSASAAACLAPLAVYMKSGSLLAIPLAGVVASLVTSVLRQLIDLSDQRGEVSSLSANSTEIFHLLPTPSPARLFSVVFAAVCAEAAFVAGTSSQQFIAIVLASLGAGIVAWQSGGRPGARSAIRSAGKLAFSWLALVLAFLLTTSAIRPQTGEGGDEPVRQPGPHGAGGQYWGVMLLMDSPAAEAQQTKSSPLSMPFPSRKEIKVPLRIKFTGEYWFFRWPNSRLPSSAEVMFGRPDEIGFRSTDSTPLVMEAHQFLQNHIDLSCCSRIEVHVRNADGLPGVIALQLLLSDSSTPLIRPLSLGQEIVAKRETFQQESREVALAFEIPEAPSISSFDQLTFRIYPDVQRRTVSPRVAIRDFTLIPR